MAGRPSPGRGRYFTYDGLLPPMLSTSQLLSKNNKINKNSTMTEMTMTSTATSPVVQAELKANRWPLKLMTPVVYTNDPHTVSLWLSENLPRAGGVLGFDVEVRFRYFHFKKIVCNPKDMCEIKIFTKKRKRKTLYIYSIYTQ